MHKETDMTMTVREFTIGAAFILAVGALSFFVTAHLAQSERQKCVTLCESTNLTPVYLPRSRMCLCSAADGNLKVPQHVPVEQEG